MALEETNPREELYNRFRESLRKPVSERFFDEEELVEIFDYAGDLNDDYVRTEALFCGARLYPDSDALADRHAMLYLDTVGDDGDSLAPDLKQYLEDNFERTSPLFDIARLQADQPADPVAALNFLIDQYTFFNDEEVIRLVDLACDLDAYDWLVTNLASLRSKVRYLPSLLYEIMRESDARTDNQTVIKLAEELIELEPFTFNYWLFLFRAQARDGRQDDARSTFDYARAIAPEDSHGLLLLCDVVYNFAPYLLREAIEAVEAVVEEYPDEFLYLDCLCSLLVQAGRYSDAVRRLKDYSDLHPDDVRVMTQLLNCNIYDIRPYLERFYIETGGRGFDESALDEITNTLLMRGAMHSLEALLDVVNDFRPLSHLEAYAYAEALFVNGKYALILDLLTEEIVTNILSVPLKGAALAFIYMVSAMKLGRQDDAEAFYNTVRPLFERLITEAPLPVRMSIRLVHTLYEKIRKHPAYEKFYWQYFDMLHYRN